MNIRANQFFIFLAQFPFFLQLLDLTIVSCVLFYLHRFLKIVFVNRYCINRLNKLSTNMNFIHQVLMPRAELPLPGQPSSLQLLHAPLTLCLTWPQGPKGGGTMLGWGVQDNLTSYPGQSLSIQAFIKMHYSLRAKFLLAASYGSNQKSLDQSFPNCETPSRQSSARYISFQNLQNSKVFVSFHSDTSQNISSVPV